MGVGEACDELFPNTSLHITTADRKRFLLDCGFTTPHIYFSYYEDPDALDGVWISHFHGDHFFGVPLLLLRFWEMGRRKKLFFAGQAGTEEKIVSAMELAYPGFISRLQFSVDFLQIKAELPHDILSTSWTVAENVHSQPCFSLRIDDGRQSVFYSGDGKPTSATISLARGCDLAVHESFLLAEEVANHGSISSCLDFARKAAVKKLALVHLERKVRRLGKENILSKIKNENFQVFLPEPGELICL